MDCLIDIDDNDVYCEFIDIKIHKARKVHKCCECHEPINIGDEYERTFGIWEGEVGNYKTCKTCKEIRDKLFCNSWTFTQVWEDMIIFIREDEFPMCMLDGLSIAAIGKLSDIIREINGDDE